jgi:hypothetical protein
MVTSLAPTLDNAAMWSAVCPATLFALTLTPPGTASKSCSILSTSSIVEAVAARISSCNGVNAVIELTSTLMFGIRNNNSTIRHCLLAIAVCNTLSRMDTTEGMFGSAL